MDYDAIDREMSYWVVTCIKNGTRFWIADNEAETATDIWRLARRYRYLDLAEEAAERAVEEFGFGDWAAMSVPDAIVRRQSIHQEARVIGRIDGEEA